MKPVVIVCVEEYDRLSDFAECPRDFAEKTFLRRQQIEAIERRRRHMWEVLMLGTVGLILVLVWWKG